MGGGILVGDCGNDRISDIGRGLVGIGRDRVDEAGW